MNIYDGTGNLMLIEQLRDTFFGRHTYHSDREWLEECGVSLIELCEENSLETHYMYPIGEFLESYVTTNA